MAIDDDRLLREIGHADIPPNLFNIWSDYLEETPELTWPESIKVFARMRRQDTQVKAVERALTLPIRRSNYHIDPKDARPEVVKRLAENLDLPILGEDQSPRNRQRGRFSFAEHLRLALLSLWYGHMVFEQVYEIEPDGFPRIKKLAERLPSTIARIHVEPDGGLKGIDQYLLPEQQLQRRVPEPYIFIPIDNLVWYVNDREGANWVGLSLLRSVYGPWLLKERLMRAGAESIIRNSMGVPVMEATDPARHYTADELSAADAFAQSFRSGDRAGGQTGRFRLRLIGVEGSIPDPRPMIQMLDEYIARNVLAQFIVLGQQGTYGNRALGESFLDTFELACNAIREQILDVFNQHVVEDWVDAAYGKDEPAPKINAAITGFDTVAPEALGPLVGAGLVQPDKPLRDFLRNRWGFPDEDPDTTMRVVPPGQQILPGGGAGSPQAPGTVVGGRPDAPPFEVAAAAPTFRRQPFPHEEGVDFYALAAGFTSALASILAAWSALRDQQLASGLEQIAGLVSAGNLAGLARLQLPTGPGAGLLARHMRALAQEAAEGAGQELEAQGIAGLLPLTRFFGIDERAQAVDELLARDLGAAMGRKALSLAGAGASGEEVAQGVADYVRGLSDQYLKDQFSGALTAAQNTGRFSIFEQAPPARTYASEILDEATCGPCRHNDGKEYDSLLAAHADYPTGGYRDCRGGPRCRGTLVYVSRREVPASVA